MPQKVIRYEYRVNSPGDDLRFEAVKKKIRADTAQLEKELCVNGGITLEKLHEHLALHTISEVDAAIKRWRTDFESHLGTTGLDTSRDSKTIGGWSRQWEQAEAEREEARAKDLQRIESMKNRGTETE